MFQQSSTTHGRGETVERRAGGQAKNKIGKKGQKGGDYGGKDPVEQLDRDRDRRQEDEREFKDGDIPGYTPTLENLCL